MEIHQIDLFAVSSGHDGLVQGPDVFQDELHKKRLLRLGLSP
jgi:hypothetical protein